MDICSPLMNQPIGMLCDKQFIAMLTYAQLAERWNVSVHDVRRLVYAKKLPALKLSHKKVRFRPADVEEFERRHMTSKWPRQSLANPGPRRNK